MRPPKSVLLILLIVLGVQVVYFLRIQAFFPPFGLTTESFYSPLAYNILHHGVYGFGDPPDIEASTFRPPFYSLWLAGLYGVLGENERFALLLNNVFLFLTVIVVMLIGRQVGATLQDSGGYALGSLAALLFFFDPINIVIVNKNNSDTLFMLLFSLFFLLTIKCFSPKVTLNRMVGCSLLLVLCTFTRAVTLYLWFPLAIALFLVHYVYIKSLTVMRLTVLVVAFIIIQLLGIGGWMMRNYSVSGNSDFAGMKAVHLMNFYAPLVLAHAENLGVEEAKEKIVRQVQTTNGYQLLTQGDRQKLHKKKAMEIIKANPFSAGQVIMLNIPVLFVNYPVKAITIFFSEEKAKAFFEYLALYVEKKASRLDVSGYPDLIRYLMNNGMFVLLAHAVVFKIYLLLLMLGGLLGVIHLVLNRQARPFAIYIAIVIGYMILVSSLWAHARPRMAFMPIVAVSASYFWIFIFGNLKPYLARLRSVE